MSRWMHEHPDYDIERYDELGRERAKIFYWTAAKYVRPEHVHIPLEKDGRRICFLCREELT